MFTKIKVRSELLKIFQTAGLPANPYSLDPFCNNIYYDYLNEHLAELKSQNKDAQTIANKLVMGAIQEAAEDIDVTTVSRLSSVI